MRDFKFDSFMLFSNILDYLEYFLLVLLSCVMLSLFFLDYNFFFF